MTTHPNRRPGNATSAASAPFWAGLLAAGLIGDLWFLLAAAPPLLPVAFAAALTLTTAVGISLRSRAHARSRLEANLNAYAEREIARSVLKRPNLQTSSGVVSIDHDMVGASASDLSVGYDW
jgi:hypothetical protein